MTVSERAIGPVTILDLVGDLKLNDGAELLRDRVRSLLQRGQTQLVLNLAGVPSVDSAGLGEIAGAYAMTTRQSGALKLLNVTKRLRDLLVITKLAAVFERFEDESAAVASFQA